MSTVTKLRHQNWKTYFVVLNVVLAICYATFKTLYDANNGDLQVPMIVFAILFFFGISVYAICAHWKGPKRRYLIWVMIVAAFISELIYYVLPHIYGRYGLIGYVIVIITAIIYFFIKQPLQKKQWIILPIYILAFLAWGIPMFLFSGSKNVELVGIAIYFFILLIMHWRAVCQLKTVDGILTLVAASSWLVSDIMILTCVVYLGDSYPVYLIFPTILTITMAFLMFSIMDGNKSHTSNLSIT